MIKDYLFILNISRLVGTLFYFGNMCKDKYECIYDNNPFDFIYKYHYIHSMIENFGYIIHNYEKYNSLEPNDLIIKVSKYIDRFWMVVNG